MRRSRTVLAAVGAALSLALGSVGAAGAVAPTTAGGSAAASVQAGTVRPAAARGTITDLGEPVPRALALSSDLGVGAHGEPQAYYLFEGNPTTTVEFVVVDLRSKSVVVDTRVPHGTSSARTLDFSDADGTVYFATNDPDTSYLYRYRPGTAAPDYLGTTLPGQRSWSLTAGPDGTVWGGTYPGGRVFSYTPANGQIHDYGQAIAGEQYASSLAPIGNQVYVGTQSHGRLARLDPAAGSYTEIALPAGTSSNGLDDMFVRRNLLFVHNEASQLLVRDLDKGSWVDQIDGFSGRGVSPIDPATGNTVYFRVASGHLQRYNIDTLTATDTPFVPNAFPERFAWVDLQDPAFPGLTLALVYYQAGRVYAYNIQTAKSYYYQPAVMGSGDQLTALGTGPDDRVYAGAYLSPPGMARWNPSSSSWELLPSAGQVEGYGSYGHDLLYGRYPQGDLLRFDTTQPWSFGTNPGPAVAIGNEQNRPQSFLTIGKQVAVTSVPETGRLGGALSLWEPDTGRVQVFRNVVPDQTPVSLAYRRSPLGGGLIWGGTSINGGYGVDPSTTEGKLFGWDPRRHTTVGATVPVPGATTVSGLVFDRLGFLWGLADSTIFQYSPLLHRVVWSKRLFPDTDGARYGEAHTMLIAGGRLYGLTDGKLFTLDWLTRRVSVLDTHASSDLIRDRAGRLYYIADSTHVHRYIPASVSGRH